MPEENEAKQESGIGAVVIGASILFGIQIIALLVIVLVSNVMH